MNNILIIIPQEWNVHKVRYVQAPTDKVLLMDADLVETPIYDTESVLNYPSWAVKEYGKMDRKELLRKSIDPASLLERLPM